MDQPKPNPVIEELIPKAISAIEDTALRLSDALENLENGQLLAALGALSGCEENIRNAAIVIRATHEYEQKLNQALDLFADRKSQPGAATGPEPSPHAPRCCSRWSLSYWSLVPVFRTLAKNTRPEPSPHAPEEIRNETNQKGDE